MLADHDTRPLGRTGIHVLPLGIGTNKWRRADPAEPGRQCVLGPLEHHPSDQGAAVLPENAGALGILADVYPFGVDQLRKAIRRDTDSGMSRAGCRHNLLESL